MNSSSTCHEIPGCKCLYVDAFRGSHLAKTRDERNSFILTHYHGDHYGSLHRDNKYQGPAKIHCTPITAALLRTVHMVDTEFVVEHKYGESWTLNLPKQQHAGGRKSKTINDDDDDKINVVITFYDANHCPGAAIVLVQLPDGTAHLHTGDMRYDPKMKSYPLLKNAALQRKIDTVLLDTTYGNPKHDFIQQETAIDTVANHAEELLGTERCRDDTNNKRTLVLLSCYSIGKERILWEVSKRTNQLIYVNDRKYKMLQCIQVNDEEDRQYVSHQIIERCTQDAKASDVHVIPMGLAGGLWPFFQPNYWACADYARELDNNYEKVVAFIPTGWAEATNWNKKNAISKCDCKGIQVEIRLVSYSEHSAFSELQEFVQFLKPRTIIPTVYKDNNDKRKIIARFKVDENRAKDFFIKSMVSSSPSLTKTKLSSTKVVPGSEETEPEEKEAVLVKTLKPTESSKVVGNDVATLEAMGFGRFEAESALKFSNGSLQAAIDSLLRNQVTPSPSPTSVNSINSTYIASKRKRKDSPKATTKSIKSFFQVKKKL